jgi:hypothetical protein
VDLRSVTSKMVHTDRSDIDRPSREDDPSNH